MTNERNANERRTHRRVPDSFMVLYKVRSPFTVRIKFGEKECDAVAQDICEGGIGLITNNEIPVGARVHLKFTVYNPLAIDEDQRSRKFEPEGEVRFGTFVKGKDYRCGIQFMQISIPDRLFISEYVRSQELKPDEA